jgi:hypothetical protein
MAGKCEHRLTTRECMVCASPKYGANRETVLVLNDVDKQTDLISRLQDEADLCRNDGAGDIATLLDEAATALAAERERCASICDGIGAGYTGAARRLEGQHATHAAGQRDGANECAAAIRRA